jgi:1,4-dihydroxy-2-naphthoate octaprenyltransferase
MKKKAIFATKLVIFTMKNTIKNWISATRPRTLLLAYAITFVPMVLADREHKANVAVFVWSLLSVFLLQILSNLANDLGDAQKGTDKERVGEKRAVQSGAISPKAMKMAIGVCGTLAIISTSVLFIISLHSLGEWIALLSMLGMSILAALLYTLGKNPYGYRGFGDLAVLVFFGYFAVVGGTYLHTKHIDLLYFLPATTMGLLAVAVLNVNNMRDLANDKKHGKMTLAVRLGEKNAKHYHLALFLLAFGSLFIYFQQVDKLLQWKILWYLPVFALVSQHLYRVYNNKNATLLDAALKTVALIALLTANLLVAVLF